MRVHLGCTPTTVNINRDALTVDAQRRNMANDDLTQDLPNNDEDRTTQPTLMSLLGLVREVKDGIDRLGGAVAQSSAEGTQLRAEVTQLRTEVTQLRTEVTQLRAEVSRLSNRLDE